MDEHLQQEYELNQIELRQLLEHCNRLSAENYRVGIHLHLIRDRLADLERRAEKLTVQFRTKTN
jgi:hypothetical protein